MDALKKRRKFRKILSASCLLVLIGVHDALSAKLAEKLGFQALWSSSFGFSATSGFPDANLLSMAENLDMIRRVINASNLPLISDCDSGYGDIVIVSRMIKEYERAGVTGICIEDNIFPKRCSFYSKRSGLRLASVKEHAAKIKMAVAQRRDKNFFVIARTEAFIAGLGLKEALKRASAYAQAGADAVCIHSKKTTASQVLSFASHWRYPVPLMAIPTTYQHAASLKVLYKGGYKVVVFANQLIRSSIRAMEKTLKAMKDENKRKRVFAEDIATLKEVFDITGVDQIRRIEEEFLS